VKPGGLPHLVWGSLRSSRFTATITVVLTALSLGLSLSTLSLRTQAKQAFLNGSGGYDAVLGARGSSLQLVLNSLFHLETSPGNIPWRLYQAVKSEKGVLRAYPMVVGDSYRGFRVVGTVPELLTSPPEGGVSPKFAAGRIFDSSRREAVLGSEAARKTNLALGQTFQPTHGLSEGGHTHNEEFLVVGILSPTNSPMDRAFWIPLEGVLRMKGHVLRGGGTEYEAQPGQRIPEEYQEVSAVLLDLDSPHRGLDLSGRINRQGKEATLAFPVAREVAEIFERLGWAHKLLSLFALATLIISAGAILASLTVAAELRRRDYALLRTLGLPRRRLATLLVAEGVLTTGLGVLLSVPLTLLFSTLAAGWVRAATGVTLDVTNFAPETPWLLLVALVLGGLAGGVPGWRVYHKDLSQQLDPEGASE
jgi:putative ABC transport system permease protein